MCGESRLGGSPAHAGKGNRVSAPRGSCYALGSDPTTLKSTPRAWTWAALMHRAFAIGQDIATRAGRTATQLFVASAIQVQGVEFFQMGQGGRLGHYPVHFHHARKTPPDTFVNDSSIHDSMTRWIVLHGTQDVTLGRNVGYKSIAHGFDLADGTEINNTLRANLGIFARAAVDNVQNPRKVPGILAAPDLHNTVGEDIPFRSDYDHPTVFWIMRLMSARNSRPLSWASGR